MNLWFLGNFTFVLEIQEGRVRVDPCATMRERNFEKERAREWGYLYKKKMTMRKSVKERWIKWLLEWSKQKRTQQAQRDIERERER